MPIDEREQDNRTLRTLIITALTETGQTRDTLYAKIGAFYYCAAPKYLYKYYSENLLIWTQLKIMKCGILHHAILTTFLIVMFQLMRKPFLKAF